MKNFQTDIQVENNRRLTMWAKLKDIEKKRKLKNEHLTPNDVREVGFTEEIEEFGEMLQKPQVILQMMDVGFALEF